MVVEGKTYFIPKGATVFPIYGVTNFDPNVFPEPYSFNPDRYESTLIVVCRPIKNSHKVIPQPMNNTKGLIEEKVQKVKTIK